jgi:hypothetical protein
MTYAQAKAHARHYAVITGRDYGVMRHAVGGCMAFALPPPEHRSGSELRCEVVRLADIGLEDRMHSRNLDDLYGDRWDAHGSKR